MSNKIPTQLENENGLHQRYLIKKLVVKPHGILGEVIEIQEPDPNAEYFVLRLDEGGNDIEHIKACRIGIHAYAEAVQHHLPELAKDLKERYPII